MIVSVVLSQLQDDFRSLRVARLGYGLHKMIPPLGYLALVDLSEDDHDQVIIKIQHGKRTAGSSMANTFGCAIGAFGHNVETQSVPCSRCCGLSRHGTKRALTVACGLG